MQVPSISVSTSFQYEIPIEQQIPLIAKAGFTHLALGARPDHSGYAFRERRTLLERLIEDHGLKIDSLHSTKLDEPDAQEKISASIEAAAELGAKCVVAHAGPFHFGAESLAERLRVVLANCDALIPILRANNILLAIENVMPGPATDLATQAINQLDPSLFGLCYDSAHDQIDGPRQFDLIKKFHGRIFAVHLSDRIKAHVDHVIPGEGFILWSEMCTALRLAHYQEPILMEVMMQHSRYDEPQVFLRKAFEAGVYTWNLIHLCCG